MIQGHHTILVVEDEPLIRMAVTDALEDEGYLVIAVSTVLEAVAALGRNHDISAIFTDIDLPGGLDGLDLVRQVRAYSNDIGIVITSGGHRADELELPSDASFVSKPYSFETVGQMLLEATQGRTTGSPAETVAA